MAEFYYLISTFLPNDNFPFFSPSFKESQIVLLYYLMVLTAALSDFWKESPIFEVMLSITLITGAMATVIASFTEDEAYLTDSHLDLAFSLIFYSEKREALSLSEDTAYLAGPCRT